MTIALTLLHLLLQVGKLKSYAEQPEPKKYHHFRQASGHYYKISSHLKKWSPPKNTGYCPFCRVARKEIRTVFSLTLRLVMTRSRDFLETMLWLLLD